ncbi:hypothetical protein [Mesorhizobium sp. M0037]|uniref:hypothetical protein n=1 Tax=unclassified Mesorhizobium TaxID=325217 RepID=UPI00333A274B
MPRPPSSDASLSPAQRLCGVRPDAAERCWKSAYLHGLPRPYVVSARVVGTGAEAICELELEDHGTVRMRAADVTCYRKFQARCAETLFLVFGWVDHGSWIYGLLRALCETAGRDAEGRP